MVPFSIQDNQSVKFCKFKGDQYNYRVSLIAVYTFSQSTPIELILNSCITDDITPKLRCEVREGYTVLLGRNGVAYVNSNMGYKLYITPQ